MLGQVIFANTSDSDQTGDLVVVQDNEISHWRSFSVDGMDEETFNQIRIPEAELGGPIAEYQIGISVENIETEWFNLSDTVPEGTIERCQREQESLLFEMNIRSDEWIGVTAACE
ncbi:hypothetical protein [Natronolimnobius baerhuensis]|nr:hypothetical protein [Natronolimnobius baerhuensis]